MRRRIPTRPKNRSRRLSLELLEERSSPTDVRSLGAAWTQFAPLPPKLTRRRLSP
jgi:hypothetical protein